MISKPLLRQTIRSNYKLFLIFTLILCLYITLVCGVFTPEALGEMSGLAQNMGGMGEMLDVQGGITNFIGQAFFGMIAFLFPTVYCIFVGNRLVAAQVDKGYLACWLSTPTRRRQITATGALYFILSLVLMFGVTAGVGYLTAEAFQPGALNQEQFAYLTLGSFLLQFAISGICFCSSCIFNESKQSLIFGAGLPLAFFLFKMLTELSEDLDFCRYFTLSSLFDPKEVLSGGEFALSFALLGVIGAVLYAVGIFVFRRKDLPL